MDIKAAVLDAMGSESPYAASKPLTIETLTLVAPGPGEVLVRIKAAGLCHSDLSVACLAKAEASGAGSSELSHPRPRPSTLAAGPGLR